MQVCANCGHLNRSGVIYCENCGASLENMAAAGATRSFGEIDSSASELVAGAGSEHFPAGSQLRFEIEGAPEPLVIRPGQQVIFGRRDPATGAMPDIDLTPYAGYRMGVSRRHAALRLTDDERLDVWDLGSSNGSFLNGQRLNAHQPYRLRDGDRLRLGQMVIRVVFQTPTGDLHDIPDHPAAAAPGSEPAGDRPAPAEGNGMIETVTGPALAGLPGQSQTLRPGELDELIARAGKPPPAGEAPPPAEDSSPPAEETPPAPGDRDQGDS